jgi:hypothetical protein
MTEHMKARPRLYDELNSSHDAVHGSAEMAIAAGFVMINLADEFISPEMNKSGGTLHRGSGLPKRRRVSRSRSDRPPAPERGSTVHYDSMIARIVHLYESRFPHA